MTRDETIDFLHALLEQKGTQEITLDGRTVSVGTICMNAIGKLEKSADAVPVVRCADCVAYEKRVLEVDGRKITKQCCSLSKMARQDYDYCSNGWRVK